MFALFKSFYRVGKANEEFKNIPTHAPFEITQNCIDELNTHVKRIFESEKAHVIVRKNDQGLYDVEFHSGIKGPINYHYFSLRFQAIAGRFSTLKYVLNEASEEENVNAIRKICHHIDGSKISIKQLKSDSTYENYYGIIQNLPSTLIYSSKYDPNDIIQIMSYALERDSFKILQYAL